MKIKLNEEERGYITQKEDWRKWYNKGEVIVYTTPLFLTVNELYDMSYNDFEDLVSDVKREYNSTIKVYDYLEDNTDLIYVLDQLNGLVESAEFYKVVLVDKNGNVIKEYANHYKENVYEIIFNDKLFEEYDVAGISIMFMSTLVFSTRINADRFYKVAGNEFEFIKQIKTRKQS